MLHFASTPDDDGGFFGIGNPFEQVGEFVSFWQDPAGNTFQTLKDSATSLVTEMLATINRVTMPDLSSEWFLKAYAVSFAMAIFLAVVLTLTEMVRTARGVQSGEQLARSLFLYWPLFMGGAMFGPMLGWLLVSFFRSLSDTITGWGVTSTVDEALDGFTETIEATDPGSMVGGVFVAILLMLGVNLATIMVGIILTVQLVTLYLTGVIVPLSLVWVISTNQRQFGYAVLRTWLMLLAAHPLTFFLLSVVFQMTSAQIGSSSGGPEEALQRFFSLVASIVALVLASIAPFYMKKFAPVLPSGGGSSESVPSTQQLGPSNTRQLTQHDSTGGSSTQQPVPAESSAASYRQPQAAPATVGADKGSLAAQTSGAGQGAAASTASAGAGAGAGAAGAGAAGAGAGAAGGAAVAGTAAAGAATGGAALAAVAVKKVADTVLEQGLDVGDAPKGATIGKDSTA